ncbi:MAG TPA: N-acetylmuramoyl-L-alanine amidase, partial [Actinomycetota bacterium]|nr:N-acetylmuramoyl-L-alanine amidase [Actinomycetota bacterium]
MRSSRIRRVLARALVVAAVSAAVLGILPPTAGASPPPTVVRQVGIDAVDLLPRSVAGGRTASGALRVSGPAWTRTATLCVPIRFTMVGFVWEQAGDSSAPARVAWGRRGAFGEPLALVAEPHEGPDPSSADDSGLTGTSPVWTGEARCARFRLRLPPGEAVGDVRAVFVNTSGTAERPSLLDRAGDALARAWGMVAEPFQPQPVSAAAGQPPIITRQQWGAAERIRRCGPDYAEDGVRMAYVHHTVNSNRYAASRADDLIRGIYAYHVKGRKFCDIAYNFLIDRFGRIYEGRFGGIDQPVVGAHAMGFNTGSTGVAALGTFTSAKPPRAMVQAYKRLLAWRLDVAHVRPTGKAVMISAGGSTTKYDKGRTVTLPAVSGHRQTGYTTCPGTTLWKRLGPIRRGAEAIGLPKLWSPRLTPDAISLWQGQTMRLQATLSGSLPWTIDIAWHDPVSASLQTVRQFSGTGSVIDVTWDGKRDDGATLAPTGAYTITFEAGSDSAPVRPAR